MGRPAKLGINWSDREQRNARRRQYYLEQTARPGRPGSAPRPDRGGRGRGAGGQEHRDLLAVAMAHARNVQAELPAWTPWRPGDRRATKVL